MPHSAVTPAGRVADLALAAAIVIAPVAGGSAHPRMLTVLLAVVLIGWLAQLYGARARGELGVPAVSVGLAAAALITALQLVPLPPALLGLLSPRAAALRDFVGDGLTLRPLSYEPAATAREAAKLLLLALTAHLAHARARAHGRVDRVAIAVVVAGLASGLVALVHRALGVDRMLGVLESARPADTLVTTFVNPNHAAGFMVMAALTAAGLALEARRRGARVGWLGAAVVLAALSVLGFSRGGLLAMLVGIALLLAKGRAARASLAAAASVVALATAGAVLWGLDGVVRDFTGSPTDPLGVAAKLGALKDAWPMILDHPWTGVGRGAYGSTYTYYKTYTYQYTFTHPENFVVQYLCDWGLLLGPLAIGALSWALWRRVRVGRGLVVAGALAGVVAVLTQNLADFSLELLGVALPAAALVGGSGAGVLKSLKISLGRPAVAPLLAASVIGAAALLATLPARLGPLEADLAAMARPGATFAEVEPLARRHVANAVAAARAAHHAERARDTAAALRWINRALYLSPTYADAHLVAGRLLLRLDHRAQGLGELRRAWALLAESPRVMEVIGEIARLARTPDELVRALPRSDPELDRLDGREIMRLLRKLSLLGQAERGRAVIEALRPALAALPPEQLLGVADEARRLGDRDTARALLLRRADAMPGDASTELAIAELFAESGQLAEAQARLERARATAAGPLMPALHRRALELALAADDVPRARDALASFRATMPPTEANQIVAYQLEGRLEVRAGRAASALEAYDRAVRLAPHSAGLRLERARTAMAANRAREARVDVDAVLRDDPANAEALRLARALGAR